MTCPAPTYAFEVPVKTASTSNLREHHFAKHRRTDAQKQATRRRCPEWTAGPLVTVRLTRVSPRKLDDDNLRGALKAVRDGVATWLRVDDASRMVRWEYEQVKGPKPSVRVEVFLSTAATLPAALLPESPSSARVLPVEASPRQRSLAELATPNVIPARRSP